MKDERSGLLTHIAMMESVSSCERMKGFQVANMFVRFNDVAYIIVNGLTASCEWRTRAGQMAAGRKSDQRPP